MHCNCDELPNYTYYKAGSGISQKLRPFLSNVAESNWRKLFRCEICGMHWRIDNDDKFQQRFVWKIGDFREDWASVELEEEQKALLLQRRGGETNEVCAWIGCGKKKVKGVAYCIDHLYGNSP